MVNGPGIDRRSAAAESQLDALDVGPDTLGMLDRVELGDGMHIETSPPDLDGVDEIADGDPVPDGWVPVDQSSLVDELCDAFNARDLDALGDLCAADCELPGLANDVNDLAAALPDLWERRPTITMTRSVDDTTAVGVVWERSETASWAAVGTCHVDVDTDGLAAVLEFSDDPGLLDRLDLDPPDGDLEEGSRWEEWAEGED